MVDLQDVHREIQYLKVAYEYNVTIQSTNSWFCIYKINSELISEILMFCTVFVDTFQRGVTYYHPFPNHAFSSENIYKKNICKCCRILQWKLAFRADCIWLCGFYKGHLHLQSFVVSLHWLIHFRSYIRAFVFLTAVFFQVTC